MVLREGGLRGEEDGEHGHEPEGKREVEVLGVGEAADEGEEEDAGGEGFEVPGRGAANLAEEDPVERDGENDSDGSEGEELLEEFVVGLLCFEFADGRDDEPVGVEAISEERLFDCVFERDGPDEGAAGEGLRACTFGVGGEICFNEAPERGEDEAGGDADPEFHFAGEGGIPEEGEAEGGDERDDGALAEGSQKGGSEEERGPYPYGAFAREVAGEQGCDGEEKAERVGMEEVFFAEAQVLGGGERPGDDGDEARTADEALHDGIGRIFGRAIAQEEPDGCDIGRPRAPVACCGGERRECPEKTEEYEAEKRGDRTEGGGTKAGGGARGRAADGGERCSEE